MDLHEHQLTDVAAVKTFLTAGKATFTLVSKKTGTRFTYKFQKSKDGNVFFLSAKDGANFLYVGYALAEAPFEVKLTKKSKLPATDTRVVAVEWVFGLVAANVLSEAAEFWHEGRCGRCGKKLTVPLSIESGIGPECAHIMGLDQNEIVMKKMEAAADKAQTITEETAKWHAKEVMEATYSIKPYGKSGIGQIWSA